MQQYLITVNGLDNFGLAETHYYIELEISDFNKCIEKYLEVYSVIGLNEVTVTIERILTKTAVAFSYDD